VPAGQELAYRDAQIHGHDAGEKPSYATGNTPHCTLTDAMNPV